MLANAFEVTRVNPIVVGPQDDCLTGRPLAFVSHRGRGIVTSGSEMYRAHQAIHERKAKTIGWGQRMFFGFLFVLIAIGASMTYAAYEQYVKVEAPPVTAPCVNP